MANYVHNVTTFVIAEFIYQRDSRNNPSLDSFIESKDDAPGQKLEHSKPAKQLTSPLATSSRSVKDPPPAQEIGMAFLHSQKHVHMYIYS